MKLKDLFNPDDPAFQFLPFILLWTVLIVAFVRAAIIDLINFIAN